MQFTQISTTSPNGFKFFVLLLLLSVSVARGQSTEGWIEYRAKASENSRITIEGTSTLHDWLVEGRIIGGRLRIPVAAVQQTNRVAGTIVPIETTVMVPARSLVSMKNGKPYSTTMDNIMQKKLKTSDHPRIIYTLTELKSATSDTPAGSYQAQGRLEVAGVTCNVVFPATLEWLPEDRLRVTGSLALKMTQFNIEPPHPLPGIKTGDDITLNFQWVLSKK